MVSKKRIAIKFVLVVLSCVLVSGDAEVRCIESEREALLSFKNGTINRFGALSSWQSDECCEWLGVECSNTTGHVTTLKISGLEFGGKVGSSSLLELHYLNHLDLGGNDFGGTPIPEFIGSMKQLQHLGLRDSNFSGSIPSQLGNLTNLRSLDLSFNSLSSISPFIFSSVFESLERLDLSLNQITGSMPDPRAFPSLIELHLSGNNFTGSIPLSIGQLSNLQILELSFNYLEGLVSESHFMKLDKLQRLGLSFNPFLHIASDWIPPFQLKDLSLAGCNVGPYFPQWIRTQRNLSLLDLSSANIRDEAPRWLWSVSSSLVSLLLSDNQISGTIPNLSSTSIYHMDLSYNQFSGPIPLFPANAFEFRLSGNMFSGSISSICNTDQHHLLYLDISNNQLAGEVPDCWEKLPNLQILNLANNSLSGEIPPSFSSLQNLNTLQMHGNNLWGELPYNLSLCRQLLSIDVGGNKLTGEIPASIGQLHGMFFLNLRGNKLHGGIPPQICNLTNIQVLDLSINNLSSVIPDCFNNFTFLDSTKSMPFVIPSFGRPVHENGYSSFQWKGREIEYNRGNIVLLKLVDFSSNGLTGNIPKSFSTMTGLRSLNLSRNSLTGYIIPDIGKMELLDSLDLSHNQLSGQIPTSLAEIHTLGVLDLSNNNLSGKIPTGTQLQSFNASAYADNDGLCGDPLPKCPGDSLRPSTTNSKGNNDDVFSFMQEVGISMGFGFIFGFWGVIGTFIWKKSWRIAFFNLFDAAGDWFYVKIAVFVSKWRRS
ncbi:hypothetical protein SASPL_132495 [Salvia splendens]|uniref:LRR receptor-like serine/threonine-protein kinase FLS2 n=2 Tax=Salvia splendens TaxID=180675 RepID=A0A8X8X195_SALSN|nr:hypothetical protein SASPL_132495 [Salvia splendens]